MYMSSPSERIESEVCVVLYLLCVLWVSGTELRFSISLTPQPKEEVEVKAGSTVLLTCVLLHTDNLRVTWYRYTSTFASVYNERDQCEFDIPHQRFETKGCTKREYTIVNRNVSKNDQAEWSCQTSSGRSQKIFMNVSRNEPTIRSQTTKSQTSWSQTTQSTPALQQSTPAIPPSNGPSSDKTTTPAENEPITDDRSGVPNGKLNMMAVIGGAVGGLIGLVLIITIVAVVRRTTTHSRDEKKPANAYRTEGSPGGQRNDFGAFEEDIGGQYAAVSDTKNPTPDKVVADNPMYESYGQEDGGGKAGISVYDHAPDVYSVVQKPLKSLSSTKDGSKNPNPPVTEDNVADVYSVVQKPSKLQESGLVNDGTKDTQPSGSDELGDVYSVVQKPAKG